MTAETERSEKRHPRVTVVEVILGVVLLAVAVGCDHFAAQALCFVLMLMFAVWIARGRRRTVLNALLVGGVVLFLVLLFLPVDLALRDGMGWSVRTVSVVSREVDRNSDGDGIRYYGRAMFVRVRWAVLITIPTARRISTPLFADPRAPFFMGSPEGSGEEGDAH
jgi:hypothetical protein